MHTVMYEGLPVQTVYLRTPFLPPNQRTLKQDQIGPSSHKHDYDAGVLLGNWVEERSAAMRKFTKVQLESGTTYAATYSQPRNPGRPAPNGPTEVGRSLLFSHGRDLDTSLYTTTNELFYTHGHGVRNLDGSIASVGDILDSSIQSNGSTVTRRGFVDRKREQWKGSNVNDAATRYHTTKSSTIDAAANCVLENPSVYIAAKEPPQKWGSSVRELNLSQRNLTLRHPIPFVRSPLRG